MVAERRTPDAESLTLFLRSPKNERSTIVTNKQTQTQRQIKIPKEKNQRTESETGTKREDK